MLFLMSLTLEKLVPVRPEPLGYSNQNLKKGEIKVSKATYRWAVIHGGVSNWSILG